MGVLSKDLGAFLAYYLRSVSDAYRPTRTADSLAVEREKSNRYAASAMPRSKRTSPRSGAYQGSSAAIERGTRLGYDVFVARNDRNAMHNGSTFGLSLPGAFAESESSPEVHATAELIDVLFGYIAAGAQNRVCL